jgi:ribonuclease BN (tRNA processing enzyme)
MKLQFIGRGGAFAPISVGNSNMILTSESGKMMLVDFGTTAPYIMRDEMGIDFKEIDSIYITHQHADHVGGLELFAFSRYFMPKTDSNGVFVKPKLYCIKTLMKELWDNTLKGGLESLQGKIMTLTDYFECKPVNENKSFDWEGYRFFPIQTVHVRSGYIIKNSYGLAINKIHYDNGKHAYTVKSEAVYITSDTQFDMGLMEFYKNSRMIFHDCETTPFKSNVHPNYVDLLTLPVDIKKKMWLYHYGQKIDSFEKDGFAGFVEKGQIFEL